MTNVATEFSNTHRISVLWTDADPAGITFYGNYFKWMDEASYYLFKAAGVRWEDWGEKWNALGIPILSAHCDFSSPSKFGDELAVKSLVSEWGNSSFTVTHYFHIDERKVAKGYEKRVFCLGESGKPQTFKSASIPMEIRRALGG